MGGDADHSGDEPPTPSQLLEMYQSGARVQSARRHAPSDQGAQGVAASDVTRHMQSDPPPGSAAAAAHRSRGSTESFDRLYSHQTHASRARVALTQSQAAEQRVTAMRPSDAKRTFAPKLATDYALSSQVRAAQSCSNRRSVGWLLRPCGFER